MSVISSETARRRFLWAQGLGRDPEGPAGPKRILRLIEDLGFVQIDSINIVERAHHLILFTRLHGYRPASLRSLLEGSRELFEHWTHDASAVPTRWFQHWRPRFARDD